MRPHRRDQQHQHRGLCQRLEGDAVEVWPERRHDGDGQQRLWQGAQSQGRQPPRQRGDGNRRQDICQREAGSDLGREAPALAPGLERQREARQHDEQSHRPRHAAHVQHGEREGAEGDELSLRHQDDARDSEDQNERQRQQRIDGAVGHAVLDEKEQDGGVQARALRIG